MHSILLLIVSTISLAISGPINILKDSENHMDEVFYVPYDIENVPVNDPTSTEKFSNPKTILPDEIAFKALKNFKNINENTEVVPTSTPKHKPEHVKDAADITIELKHKSTEDNETSFDLFAEKFNHDPSKTSENFVLGPISVISKLQDSTKSISLSKMHTIVKRQAPGNDFRVYRPVVQFRRVFRDRRRIIRPPAFVGYLNDYDHFPTVA